MKKSGFTLIEVLVALIILVVAYTALLHLHILAIHTLTRSENLFSEVSRLELFLAGEPVEGVKVERRTFKVKGLAIQEEIYRVSQGNETAYYRLYERR
ncbi:prepilin-type N-terminal cleavage/methylation domain-containing protein [Thermosulfurimonas sp.]|uniref:type IV pilus modification PilV family protein n=1 Tax=Thermosulfurimonas sp. TaxID=2080236 RepID=UPI0025FD22E9|nr:prepilin-type N-terminal cleavage/methylation domain-containing protein [Thermosulfurimonas sp.]